MIRCAPGGDQCPPGWGCTEVDSEGVGTCTAPGGDGTDQLCPGLGSTWAETSPGAPNPDLAFQVACMADVGTDGCGFEQQLQAGRRGLKTSPGFIRERALLGVLVVSDEEDCSIEDGSIFQQAEITDLAQPHELNLLCGRHQDMLYDPSFFKQAFLDIKGGREEAVVFAAIAGVPPVPTCQGRGADLDACLDHERMQLVEVLEESWVYAPACERHDGDQLVTKARPGRRYVSLAGQMKQRSYVYSICNESWSPAMSDIAALIADQFKGTCYPKPLQWDPATRQARCDVVVEYLDTAQCPFDLDDGRQPSSVSFEDADGLEHERLLCPLPRLSAPLDCAAADAALAGASDEIGWYYCEDNSESFETACDPDGDWAGLDEDGDGLTDCEDPYCAGCQACDPTSTGCGHACRYSVRLTDGAEQLTLGRQLSLQCLQQFELDDDNCAEITVASCTDGLDNDGNGVWDCDDELEGEVPHRADPA
ncbi:MAG: hypothetical protein JRI55_15450, partial [Deltaproteobacteria bacterium]|nr:hypothetical protein [Deltaproteobacteria bacterium]